MLRKLLLAAVAGVVVMAAGAATAEAGRCYRGGYGYGGGYYYGGYGPRVSHYYGGRSAYYPAPYRHSYYRGGYGYGPGYGYGYGYPRSGVSFSIGF